MKSVLTSVCKIVAGHNGLSIVSGEEDKLGHLLAERIASYRATLRAEPSALLGFGAKYKSVAQKKNPVPVSVPSLHRQPYKPMPQPVVPPLPTHPTPFHQFPYTDRLTPERVNLLVSKIPKRFLMDDEISLLLWVVAENETSIAFDDSERGTYKSEYFPDYVMETIPHEPWCLPPIRIPDSIKGEVADMIDSQLKNGNLELSTSSYRSRVFAVQKPHGGLRIVHDLQPLNSVSVKDAMLPPNVLEFAESFVGHSIYGTLDLYSGFHQRTIHRDSRPLTACQTPRGNVQLTSLPMGYTNSMQEFQRATTHIIEPLGPKKAANFVDDVSVKGPTTRYGNASIPENPNIRQFVWEYAHTLYACLSLLATAGATASGSKLHIATPRVSAVGYECDLEGMKPQHGIITKVLNWPVPHNVKGVRGFLGTVGVTRNWIRNYARLAKPLTLLTKLEPRDFYWPDEAQRAFDIIKEKVSEVVALKKLDIELAKRASLTAQPGKLNEGRVVLAVDTSWIAIGYVLYQVFRTDDEDLRPADGKPLPPSKASALVKYPIRFGSITLKEPESRYSQAKLELFGLYRALRALRHMLWGLNVLIEADASFLRAMVNSPELPNAAATRWIVYIHLFDIEFKHIPAENHVAPDGLSRRPPADDDTQNSDLGEDLDETAPFIKAVSTCIVSFESAEPHLEVDLVDLSFAQITKLHARSGEPIDVVRRRSGNASETLHLARVEPGDSLDTTLCSFTTVDVRTTAPSSKTRTLAPASVQSSPTRGEERDPSAPAPGEDLQLHEHHVLDPNDGDLYWQNIISYLTTSQIPPSIPKTRQKRKSFIQTVRRYFLAEDVLWRRTKDGVLPRRVIQDVNRREELIRQAHEESGHRGRDPTHKKLVDFYFWPNMFAQVALFCRTCERCQLRSTEYPKVAINPTWVPTVLRKFNMDLVEMGIRSDSYEYIVDIRDDLTGWLEARMLVRKSADLVADFLWQDVICRFGCIPQITTDNGTEFQGAVDVLTKKYGITVVRVSPYNPAANGMIERSHRTWINSIWKLCAHRKHTWSRWFYPALWADRVTTRRSTGFSPYYLLYGRPHLFPFNITDETWYTIDWHGLETTEDLLAIRALQIKNMHAIRKEAVDRVARSRVEAAEQYAAKHARRLISGQYGQGEFVLVALKGPGIVRGSNLPKSADRWAGPFKIVKRFISGSYQLSELDGSILKGSVPAGHLKPFYTRHGQLPPAQRMPDTDESDSEDPFGATDSSSDFQPGDED